jgi:1,4-dihydroxy-2-naphthoyl-CoA hydrolase
MPEPSTRLAGVIEQRDLGDLSGYQPTAGLEQELGLRYEQISGDRVVIHWDITPRQHQPFGIVHGGVYCSVVESAASIGAQQWLGSRGRVVGVSNATDFLRAATDGQMTATATPVHQGRSQQLWQVEIRDEQQRLVARGQVRLQNLSQ